MSLIQVTPPEPLFTAEEAQTMVPGLAGASEAQVDAWLLAATMAVQSFIERAIGEQTWDWKPWGADTVPVWPLGWSSLSYPYNPWIAGYSAWPPYLELPLRPLISVDSFKFLDEAGAEQTWDPANYLVSGVGDVGRITLAAGANWPALGNYPEPVTIQFTAGYPVVPEPLKQAVLLETAGMQTELGGVTSGASGAVRSRTIEGLGTETYDVGGSSSSSSSTGSSKAVTRLLQPYRVF